MTKVVTRIFLAVLDITFYSSLTGQLEIITTATVIQGYMEDTVRSGEICGTPNYPNST